MEELSIGQIAFNLAEQNSQALQTINRELGGIETSITFIQWFIGINVVAWVGVVVSFIGKKLFRNNKKGN